MRSCPASSASTSDLRAHCAEAIDVGCLRGQFPLANRSPRRRAAARPPQNACAQWLQGVAADRRRRDSRFCRSRRRLATQTTAPLRDRGICDGTGHSALSCLHGDQVIASCGWRSHGSSPWRRLGSASLAIGVFWLRSVVELILEMREDFAVHGSGAELSQSRGEFVRHSRQLTQGDLVSGVVTRRPSRGVFGLRGIQRLERLHQSVGLRYGRNALRLEVQKLIFEGLELSERNGSRASLEVFGGLLIDGRAQSRSSRPQRCGDVAVLANVLEITAQGRPPRPPAAGRTATLDFAVGALHHSERFGESNIALGLFVFEPL
mmetsp:Transcript_76704/g.213188  ORF Transcript_76704/g.213188 Transcript_76704/m.213188 type:complete len:320 (-) Transcript_76704:3-962(-)